VSWSGRKGFARMVAPGCFIATLPGRLSQREMGYALSQQRTGGSVSPA
jgi:hypothetical protein